MWAWVSRTPSTGARSVFPFADDGMEGVDRLDLGRQVGRGVHQIDVAGPRDVDRQARDVAGERRIPPRRRAVGAIAPRLRHAAVLGDAEDDDAGGGAEGGAAAAARRRTGRRTRSFMGLLDKLPAMSEPSPSLFPRPASPAPRRPAAPRARGAARSAISATRSGSRRFKLLLAARGRGAPLLRAAAGRTPSPGPTTSTTTWGWPARCSPRACASPSFRWTPFSISYDHFADGEPLFHLLLMPFARLPLQTAGLLGVLLGQLFLVGAFAAALWIVRAPRPWWFVLALGGLGTLFAQRMEMCRPHVWLIGFTVLVAALLVERRWKALFVACALFALTHAGAWIAIPLALLWSLCGLLVRQDRERPRSAASPGSRSPSRRAAGSSGSSSIRTCRRTSACSLITNFVIPFQAATASNAALALAARHGALAARASTCCSSSGRRSSRRSWSRRAALPAAAAHPGDAHGGPHLARLPPRR